MKKAFSMIELIFVVVLIGILSAVITPRFERSSLREAANQIVSHLRYTQHLAMIDDKFDPKDQFWYKKRWQLQFKSGNPIYYYIYNDLNTDNAVSQNELAKDPMDSTKYLTGDKSISINSGKYNKNMNLTEKFDVQNITFSSSCSFSSSKRISFDYIGRPYRGTLYSMTTPYQSDRIIRDQCTITLQNSESELVKIAIEEETGYVYILD
jgi:prepilin-type N-terminal cleavage/methylation domain-containing protein